MYFKFFKLQSWDKRSASRRRRFNHHFRMGKKEPTEEILFRGLTYICVYRPAKTVMAFFTFSFIAFWAARARSWK